MQSFYDTCFNRSLATFEKANRDQVNAGIRWYPTASLEVAKWAIIHGYSFPSACNIWAVASTNTSWKATPKAVENGMKGWGLPYVTNLIRLQQIGHPIDLMFTNKLFNFSWNLRGSTNVVTLDRWMARIVKKNRLTPNQYGIYSRAMQAVASQVGVEARELQAINWIVIRGSHE